LELLKRKRGKISSNPTKIRSPGGLLGSKFFN
jgi:hypothetical protein